MAGYANQGMFSDYDDDFGDDNMRGGMSGRSYGGNAGPGRFRNGRNFGYPGQNAMSGQDYDNEMRYGRSGMQNSGGYGSDYDNPSRSGSSYGPSPYGARGGYGSASAGYGDESGYGQSQYGSRGGYGRNSVGYGEASGEGSMGGYDDDYGSRPSQQGFQGNYGSGFGGSYDDYNDRSRQERGNNSYADNNRYRNRNSGNY